MSSAIVVDDSPIVRMQLRQILARIGCTVVAEAGSGDQVRALYAKHHPDLVTMDIVMPGKDGVAAAVELLREFPTATIVMCTSLATREKVLACRRAGVVHYLLKPFEPEHAQQMLRHALERATGADARSAQ
ncbi:MAG TPA: response regulator [Kofleriaceae bacterium]|jgi:DNA-binding NarL/FixJ family response regulator